MLLSTVKSRAAGAVSCRVLIRIFILVSLLIVSLGLNLCLGDFCFTPAQVWNTLTHPAASDSLATVLWEIRLPRALIALSVGVGLSVSGYLLQALSRNHLADPYLSGVSSGAGLAVAVAMMCGLDFSLYPPVAFVGAIAASLIVAIMSRTPAGISVTRLLLSGVALSAMCGALITLLLVNSANPAHAQGLFFWLAGGIGGRNWSELASSALYIGLGLIVAFVLSKSLRVLSVGVQSASSLGLDVAKTQWGLLGAAVLMCGAAVSVSGLVGFVGLIAPQMARRLFGRDERVHIAAAAMIGAALVLVSDLAARTAGQGQELPLGTLLALIGGPFFLFMVLKQRGENL